MVLNYVWIGCFIIAFFVAILQCVIFQDYMVFERIVRSTFLMSEFAVMKIARNVIPEISKTVLGSAKRSSTPSLASTSLVMPTATRFGIKTESLQEVYMDLRSTTVF